MHLRVFRKVRPAGVPSAIAITLLFWLVVVPGSVSEAADHRVCNKTNYAISLALSDWTAAENEIVTWGWFVLRPGACIVALPNHEFPSGHEGYYARAGNGTVWEGSVVYCVDPVNAFRIVRPYPDSNGQCRTPYVPRKFRSLNPYRDLDLTL